VFAPDAVLPQEEPVVAPDDDDGALVETGVVQRAEDATDLGIHVADTRGAGAAQFSSVLGIAAGIAAAARVVRQQFAARMSA
jgi:hypothetical protein